ncbi:MATE family efflux transporter [Marinibactrum halimedae]|uniref:Multidrug-efflux transporter n=1 Tax=Marinibactrum halimedae TaxID=1444977 RepID=A0AA37WLW2_9GAMM|nr:MATE family efflux transporter [Marinibactrum halimedae]MCD9457457.1 MATE family efflux transporter [Marinibactrum halimedae]GLS25490.1 multidrug resistance protein NorM [Marinibactrum halimedae]
MNISKRSERFFTEASILLKLGFPLIISHLAIIGMGATDTLMAGRVNTANLAGLAIGSGIWSALSVFILGICGSTATIAAQLHGARRRSRIGFQMQQSLWIGLATALIIASILICAPFWIPRLNLGDTANTISAHYLSVLSLGCIGFTLTAVLRGICEAVGDTHLAMWTNISIFLLNIVLDYAFVFGKWGLPEMGAIGCAWASNCAYWIAFGILFIILQRHSVYRTYHLFSKLWRPQLRHAKAHLAIGVPLAIGVSAEVFFFTGIASFAAPLGDTAVAAHQIVQSFGAVLYMMPLGLSVALCIRCAQLRGANQTTQAAFAARSGVAVAASLALLSAIITLLLRDWVPGWYTPDLKVQRIASDVLILCAIYQFMDAIQATSWGALRGYGDVKVPMGMQLTAYWVVGFPIGWGLAYPSNLGIFGFWIGIVSGLSTAAVLMGVRLLYRIRVEQRQQQPLSLDSSSS